MTPDRAAGLLGISVHASDSTIRTAFRARARAAHPDSGGSAQDLAELTNARDLLLEVPTTSSPDPTSGGAAPRSGPVRPSPPPRRGPSRGSAGRLVYAVIGSAIALVAVAAVVFVIVAIATGGGDTPEVTIDECLTVTDDGVVESACDAPGALRVVGEFSGARSCPPGSNSLVVGSTTWCLEPIAAG